MDDQAIVRRPSSKPKSNFCQCVLARAKRKHPPTEERMQPDQIAQKGPGQESVWDYPRPPRVEDSSKHLQVIFNGLVIAETRQARRVLETSHPPVYYIPPQDVKLEYLTPTDRATFCEFKGAASYYTVRV